MDKLGSARRKGAIRLTRRFIMTITEEEAIARIMLGLKFGSMKLIETTKKKGGSKAIVLCITAPGPMGVQVRPIAELKLIRDAADSGKLYNRPTTMEMNSAWEKMYGKPIGR